MCALSSQAHYCTESAASKCAAATTSKETASDNIAATAAAAAAKIGFTAAKVPKDSKRVPWEIVCDCDISRSTTLDGSRDTSPLYFKSPVAGPLAVYPVAVPIADVAA